MIQIDSEPGCQTNILFLALGVCYDIDEVRGGATEAGIAATSSGALDDFAAIEVIAGDTRMFAMLSSDTCFS